MRRRCRPSISAAAATSVSPSILLWLLTHTHTHTHHPLASVLARLPLTCKKKSFKVASCQQLLLQIEDGISEKWRDFWCKYTTNNFTDADDAFLCVAKTQIYKKMLVGTSLWSVYRICNWNRAVPNEITIWPNTNKCSYYWQNTNGCSDVLPVSWVLYSCSRFLTNDNWVHTSSL